jgi:GDP-D-mannose dehydratase
MLEAMRQVCPKARFYQASSSEMFGKVREPPQTELTPFHPRSPYAVAKTYGHYITVNYRESYGCSPPRASSSTTRARVAGWSSSPARSPTAWPHQDWACATELRLGNLDAHRDWGFAGDYVRAMWLMMQHDVPDDYVVATGEAYSVRDFCEFAFAHAGLDYKKYVVTDPKFLRPAEVDYLMGDPTKAKTKLGWQPEVNLRKLVEMMVDADLERSLVRDARPDACLHMAGIAYVPRGWTEPDLVFSVNVEGTIRVLEALRRLAPAARTLVISSAQVYGNTPRGRPLTEDDALEPDNLYGVSKVAADLMALLYARRYGMAVMTARPCNHIGPGQSTDFVVPAFAAQLKAIAAGRREPVMRVGNLESLREFADVRDVARAYRLLLEGGVGGRAYNIATGKLVKIGDLLERLCQVAGVRPAIEVEPKFYRPTDAQPALDTARICGRHRLGDADSAGADPGRHPGRGGLIREQV